MTWTVCEGCGNEADTVFHHTYRKIPDKLLGKAVNNNFSEMNEKQRSIILTHLIQFEHRRYFTTTDGKMLCKACHYKEEFVTRGGWEDPDTRYNRHIVYSPSMIERFGPIFKGGYRYAIRGHPTYEELRRLKQMMKEKKFIPLAELVGPGQMNLFCWDADAVKLA